MPGGRPPKPTAVLRLTGTYRKDRHARRGKEPQPSKPARVPPPPVYLDDVGKQEWSRVARELHGLGLLTVLDMASLAGYCASFARARAAEETLKAKGTTYCTPQGIEMPRPEVAIAKNAWTEVRKFGAEFGLTPSARVRVKAPDAPPDPKVNEFARLDARRRFFGGPNGNGRPA